MKTCPKCNAQVEDDAKFCNSCGYGFETPAQDIPQGIPQPQPQPQSQAQPQPQPQSQSQPQLQSQYSQAQYQNPQYQQGAYQQIPTQQPPVTPLYDPVNPCDKALGIVAVMFGFLGVIIAYFGGDVNGQRSEYLRFYANEGLVLALFALIGLIPFLGWLWSIFNFVCMIIAIVYACKGVTKPVLFYGTIRIIK